MSRATRRAVTISRIVLGAAVLAMPLTGSAHNAQSGVGFVAGVLHPVSGLDHFLAMLSIGIVSAQLRGIRIFTVPAVFVVSMVVGTIIGVLGIPWPGTELGIAVSVIILGLAIVAARAEIRSLPIMPVIAFFGSLHGYAHGREAPTSADPVYYIAGFVLSTAAIHLLGVAVGHFATSYRQLTMALRHAGSFMAGAGFMILVRIVSAP